MTVSTLARFDGGDHLLERRAADVRLECRAPHVLEHLGDVPASVGRVLPARLPLHVGRHFVRTVLANPHVNPAVAGGLHRCTSSHASYPIGHDSNRCFPTKAIHGWLAGNDRQHCDIVAAYFECAGGWHDVRAELRRPGEIGRDPLYAVYAFRA
jgi:hypothetical protein